MILETITVDWRCRDCGTVRRIDVDDVSRSVIAYRPQGWTVIQGKVNCATCSPTAPKTEQMARFVAQGERAEDLRDRLSTLHAGRAPEDPAAAAGMGVRQPPPAAAANYPPPIMVRDASGNETAPKLAGERSFVAQPSGPTVTPPAQQWTGKPPHTLSGGGGVSSAQATPDQGTTIDPGDATGRKEARFGNVVFEDTRSDSGFVGPQVTQAGVPSLNERCPVCHQVINDGTKGEGGSEPWRMAHDAIVRGHRGCLDRVGR